MDKESKLTSRKSERKGLSRRERDCRGERGRGTVEERESGL